jgi:hypothetical protein
MLIAEPPLTAMVAAPVFVYATLAQKVEPATRVGAGLRVMTRALTAPVSAA